MLRPIALILLLIFPVISWAQTRLIDCSQKSVSDGMVMQVVKVRFDEGSDKAEVHRYYTTDGCAITQSCKHKIYDIKMLPSTIKLSDKATQTSVTWTEIEISRDDLSIETETRFQSGSKRLKSTYRGKCKLIEDNADDRLL